MTAEQVKRLAELETIANTRTVSAGNGSAQAQAALALFAANGNKLTGKQLQTVNAKYPSDPVYYARKAGALIDTVRRKGNADGSIFVLRMTPAQVAELASLKAEQAKGEQKAAVASK